MVHKEIAVLSMLLLLISQQTTHAENEIHMTLYVGYAVYNGSSPNGIWVVDTVGRNPTRFGSIIMLDLALSDGPRDEANIIGRALYVDSRVSSTYSNIWYTALNLRFENESSWLYGSTLQIAGLTPPGDCEWSIIGGTGQLAMVRGVVIKTVIAHSSKSAQLDIYAYYGATTQTTEVSGKLDDNNSRRELRENIYNGQPTSPQCNN